MVGVRRLFILNQQQATPQGGSFAQRPGIAFAI
jgi:hypothetical protein